MTTMTVGPDRSTTTAQATPCSGDAPHVVEVVCADVPNDTWDVVRHCWETLSDGLEAVGACARTESFHTRNSDGDILAVFAVVWIADDDVEAVHRSDYSLDRMLRALGLPDRVDLQLLRRFPTQVADPVARSA